MDAEQRAAVLGDTDLVSTLDRGSLRVLGERATHRPHEAGTALYQQGDSADELFVVEKGHVELAVVRGDRGEDVVSTPGSKEAFGEAALYDDGPRMVTARAVEDTTLWRCRHRTSGRSFERSHKSPRRS